MIFKVEIWWSGVGDDAHLPPLLSCFATMTGHRSFIIFHIILMQVEYYIWNNSSF